MTKAFRRSEGVKSPSEGVSHSHSFSHSGETCQCSFQCRYGSLERRSHNPSDRFPEVFSNVINVQE